MALPVWCLESWVVKGTSAGLTSSSRPTNQQQRARPSTSVKFALIPLAKASHMTKARISVEDTPQKCVYTDMKLWLPLLLALETCSITGSSFLKSYSNINLYKLS